MRRGRVGWLLGSSSSSEEWRVQPAAAQAATPTNCIPAAIREETTTFEETAQVTLSAASKKRLFGRYEIYLNLILLSRCAVRVSRYRLGAEFIHIFIER
jgi:hypothetical protein